MQSQLKMIFFFNLKKKREGESFVKYFFKDDTNNDPFKNAKVKIHATRHMDLLLGEMYFSVEEKIQKLINIINTKIKEVAKTLSVKEVEIPQYKSLMLDKNMPQYPNGTPVFTPQQDNGYIGGKKATLFHITLTKTLAHWFVQPNEEIHVYLVP
jgi:hypothetical protein